MITNYFTFGQTHIHNFHGKILDKDCVVKITAEDPRGVMFEHFDNKWAMQYNQLPDMKHFPRGVIEI